MPRYTLVIRSGGAQKGGTLRRLAVRQRHRDVHVGVLNIDFASPVTLAKSAFTAFGLAQLHFPSPETTLRESHAFDCDFAGRGDLLHGQSGG